MSSDTAQTHTPRPPTRTPHASASTSASTPPTEARPPSALDALPAGGGGYRSPFATAARTAAHAIDDARGGIGRRHAPGQDATDGARDEGGGGDREPAHHHHHQPAPAPAPTAPGATPATPGATPTTPEAPAPAPAPAPADPLTITSQTTARAADGSGSERRTVGVGEEVTFTGNRSGTWTANGGLPATVEGNTFRWRAPIRPASVTITLRTADGQTSSVTMEVVKPSSVTSDLVRELPLDQYRHAKAGMDLRMIYHPLSVSFANLMIKEASGPATNITGYYLHVNSGSLWHNSGEEFGDVRADNKDSYIDSATQYGRRPPWIGPDFRGGGFDWVIPYRYLVHGEGGNGEEFTHVVQSIRLDAYGTMSVAKAGQRVSQSPP